MDEQIANEMRRLIPFPWENLSPEEIEEREDSMRRKAKEDASKHSSNVGQTAQQEATHTLIDILESEKPQAEGRRRRFIENFLRRLRGH